MLVLGIDPGLQRTGWGIVSAQGHALKFIACGLVTSKASESLAERLAGLFRGLDEVCRLYKPDTAAVEETFVNKNPVSTLKLGQARGVALTVPALHGIGVSEYAANTVKKSVVGAGHAQKDQIGMMVRTLLPACGQIGPDEADALAVAICHAHHGKIRAAKLFYSG